MSIAPLGFAIDTAGLAAGKDAADKAAESFKVVGVEAKNAQQAVKGMTDGGQQAAQSVDAQTKAAEAQAAALTKVAEAANKAKDAQTALANAPKPAMTPGMNDAPAPPKPVMSKSGGYYADQAMADWADAQADRRASEQRAQNEMLASSRARTAPAAAAPTQMPMGTSVPITPDADGLGGVAGVTALAGASDKAREGVGRLTGGLGLLNVVGGAVGAVIGGFLVKGLIEAGKAAVGMADDAELLERRMTAITGSADEATAAISRFDRAGRDSITSNRAQTGVQSTLLGASGLGVSGADIGQFGSTLAKIDQISGNKAADFAKFGNDAAKALEDGVVSAAELNKMIDASPALAQRLADGLNMPIDQVKRLAVEGGLFTTDFIKGLNDVDAETGRIFGSLEKTAEQGFEGAKNAAGRFFEALIDSDGLQKLTTSLTDAITRAFEGAEKDIKSGDFWGNILGLGEAPTSVAGSLLGNGIADKFGLSRGNMYGSANATSGGSARLDAMDAQLTGGGANTPQARAAALGVDITRAIPTANLGSGYRSAARQAELVKELPGIASPTSRHPTGGAYDFQVPGLGAGDVGKVEGMLRQGGVEFEDVLYHNNHFHVERGPGGAGRSAGGGIDSATQGLISGATQRVPNLENELQRLRALPPSTPGVQQAILAKENELRSARAAQQNLSRTPLSRATGNMADRQRAEAMGGGGGGSAIVGAALSANRSGMESGYGNNEAEYMSMGITGAVMGASGQTERLRQQAEAERGRGASVMGGRLASEQADVKSQTEAFQFQNFGKLESGEITRAVDEYRKALEALNEAQRDTANAQELLNAQTEAGVSGAAAGALAAGGRGYAVELARQQAEEAAIARDGGSVTASRTRFDARNRLGSAEAAAAANDNASADGRYMGIGGDAFSRRQYGRGEQVEQAGREFDGETRQAELRAQFAREDARLAKDRADADAEGVRVAERRLELAGLFGADRRAAIAILERENELVADGLLPAGERLSEIEATRVAANAERLRLIGDEVQRAEELAAIAENAGQAVGGGLRSVFSDLFADGKIEAEKLVGAVQGIVSRIGTNIADVLIIRPIERATEKVADIAVDFIEGLVGGGRGGGGAAKGAAGAAGDIKATAAASAKTSADTRGAVAATARASADTRAAVAINAATGSLARFTIAVNAAAAAAGGDAASDFASKVITTAAKGPTKAAALGDTFGGIGASPTLFPMAGGTGLAFEAGPEAVLPLKRGADGRLGVAANDMGGGGGTSITVIDQRGAGAAPVETQESQGPDGKRMISMLIRGETRAAIKQGEMDGAMRDSYGIQRQIARR